MDESDIKNQLRIEITDKINKMLAVFMKEKGHIYSKKIILEVMIMVYLNALLSLIMTNIEDGKEIMSYEQITAEGKNMLLKILEKTSGATLTA